PGGESAGAQRQAAEAEEGSALHSVTIMGVEARLDAEQLGQFAALQAMELVQVGVEGVQIDASGLFGAQLAEWALQGGQLLAGAGVLPVDALGQGLLIIAEQAAQAILVGPEP